MASCRYEVSAEFLAPESVFSTPGNGGSCFLSPHTCCGQGCRDLCPVLPDGSFVATPGSSPRFQGRRRCPGVGSQRRGFALYARPALLVFLGGENSTTEPPMPWLLLVFLTGGNTVPGYCGSWESGLAMPELGVPGGRCLIGRGKLLLPGSVCPLPSNH